MNKCTLKSTGILRLFNGVKNFRQLEQRIIRLPTEQDRGHAFEVFAEAYLSIPNLASVNAKNVWVEKRIPYSVRQKLVLPDKDKGVDGVLELQLGEYHTYQVKFRSGRTPLCWREISTFVGLSDRAVGKLVITNCLDFAEDVKKRRGFYAVTAQHLNQLTLQDFQNIYNWIAGGQVKFRRKSPRPHQQEALNDILLALQSNDRAAVIMACGTGKTAVEMWTAERSEAQLVLVLLPSLPLMRQLHHEWVREISRRMATLCVCSDPTVTKGADEARGRDCEQDQIVLHPSEVDFPVTTDAGKIKEFLNSKFDGMRVVFSTYHSSNVVAKGLKASRVKSFDVGLFDEAHKTAGTCGRTFSLALHENLLPIKKRVFFTATPRHYNIRVRDKQGNAKLAFSMDNKDDYGPVVHKLSFAKAAERDIICPYKVVISIVTSEEVNHQLLKTGEVLINGDTVRAHQVANQLSLKRLSESPEYEVTKIFTFHRTVNSAKSFAGSGPEGVGTHLKGFKTFYVEGKMSSSKREEILHEFRHTAKGLISNARCLTEGVDVPAVDCVAFMATKESHVDIVQATGRAMRKAPGKNVGYIFLPLYLELEENETLEKALKRSKYDTTWDVLEAMAEQDDVLAEIISSMRIKQGEVSGFDDNRFRQKVDFLAPTLLLKTLRKAITLRCVEVCGELWDYRFGQLLAFEKKHKHCNVPAQYKDNPALGGWVASQRDLYRRRALPLAERLACRVGLITDEQISRLNEIGFVWEPLDTAWEEKFAQLKDYKEKNGNCDVPKRWKQNPSLGQWLLRVRKRYEARLLSEKERLARQIGLLSDEQIRRLEELGFDWDPYATAWNEKFRRLKAYKKANGDCNVPLRYPEDQELGRWVGNMRNQRRHDKLSEARIQLLDSIGFEWEQRDGIWETQFKALQEYHKQTGNCDVPAGYNNSLLNWVRTQRAKAKNVLLTTDQFRRLDKLGFTWDAGAGTAWEAQFKTLEAYYRENGDCNVPAEWKQNPMLGRWVSGLRKKRKDGDLTTEQIQRLDKMGFDWNPNHNRWEERFAELQAWAKKKGHCRFPVENSVLGKWVSHQRADCKMKILSPARIKRLDEIGFEWDPIKGSWNDWFIKLEAYQKKNGHCNVPGRAGDGLGNWVVNQRQIRKRGGMPEDRIQLLDGIGFQWDQKAEERQALWDTRFAELKAYKKEHGHCNVPKDGSTLGTWVQAQRRGYKKGTLAEDRKRRLNATGFVWNTKL